MHDMLMRRLVVHVLGVSFGICRVLLVDCRERFAKSVILDIFHKHDGLGNNVIANMTSNTIIHSPSPADQADQ